MQQSYEQTRAWWLSKMALAHVREAHWQLSPAVLVEEAIQKKEGVLSQEGALVCDTGKFTGRSPRDKFIVQDDVPIFLHLSAVEGCRVWRQAYLYQTATFP